jgi:hypothetical protein
MNLKNINFDEFSHLRYEFFLETTGKNPFQYTLIVKWIGVYRVGSLGNPDAYYMQGITKTALGIWHPAALILDLSEFEYEWGDLLEAVFDVGEEEQKTTAIVVGFHCKPAISTLIWGVNSDRLATEQENIFDSVEEAWAYVRKDIQ